MGIETSTVVPKLPLYIYSDDIKTLKNKNKNKNFVFNTINVWYEVRKFPDETHSLSCFSLIWGNHGFTPGRADLG
jgi:hypothetical protein